VHPYLFRIPLPWGRELSVPSYGLMVMLGFLLGLYFFLRRGRSVGLDRDALLDVGIAALVGGVVGARLFFVISEWGYFAVSPLEIIRIDKGGLWFYGGALGGAVAALATMWVRKLPVRRTLDVMASVLPLGHAFGRMGCFLNGCCFGKVTGSFIGVRFPRVLGEGRSADALLNIGDRHILGSPPYVDHLYKGRVFPTDEFSLPVHPTQLYAVAYNVIIFAVLSFLLFRRRREGDVTWFYAVFYGSARFMNEFYRDDLPAVAMGLKLNQWLCVGLVIFGLVMFCRSARRRPQPLPGPFSEEPQPEEECP